MAARPLGWWRHLDGRRKLPAPSLYIVLAISRRTSELGLLSQSQQLCFQTGSRPEQISNQCKKQPEEIQHQPQDHPIPVRQPTEFNLRQGHGFDSMADLRDVPR